MNVNNQSDDLARDTQAPAPANVPGSGDVVRDHIAAIQFNIWGPADQPARRRVIIEEIDEDEEGPIPEEPELAESNPYDDTWWNEYIDEILESELQVGSEVLEGSGLSAVEQLGEEFEQSYNATCEYGHL